MSGFVFNFHWVWSAILNDLHSPFAWIFFPSTSETLIYKPKPRLAVATQILQLKPNPTAETQKKPVTKQ